MHEGHGKVGGNVFLAVYLMAAVSPLVDAWASPQRSLWWVAGAACLVLATSVLTTVVIRQHGGGGAGEPLGCLSGAVVWLGRVGVPVLASRLGVPPIRPGFWALLGASLPVFLMAFVVWVVGQRRRNPGQ